MKIKLIIVPNVLHHPLEIPLLNVINFLKLKYIFKIKKNYIFYLKKVIAK